MYSHLMVGCNDLEKSGKFYDALFAAMGGKPGMRPQGRDQVIYMHNGGVLVVTKPLNGEPATHSNGGTIGISMSSPAEVEAWHAAGVANGGTTCEDPPGARDNGMAKMHVAYLRDPDNNKLCGIYRYPAD